MPRPFTLPEDDRELEDLIRKHGQAEVARMFGVTRAAVSAAVRSRKLNIPRRADYSHYIPWVIGPEEHKWHYVRRMLYINAKQKTGAKTTPDEDRRVEEFRNLLDTENLSVVYDGDDDEKPWKLVPREAGDRDYIRPPLPGDRYAKVTASTVPSARADSNHVH